MLTGCIVEGVAGSGKTTLLACIQSELASRSPGCTKLFLSEHYTERIFEDRRASHSVSGTDVLTHSARLIDMLEGLYSIKQESKFANSASNATAVVFLERWLGSHAAHLEMSGSRCMLGGLRTTVLAQYERLRAMGLGVVVLHIPDYEMAARLEVTIRDRNPGWRDYLERLGGVDRALMHFQEWQRRLLDFYGDLGIDFEQLETAPPHELAKALLDKLMKQPAAA